MILITAFCFASLRKLGGVFAIACGMYYHSTSFETCMPTPTCISTPLDHGGGGGGGGGGGVDMRVQYE